MSQKQMLHILNGQAMYDFYKETDFLKGERIVPFNEAMCYGDTSEELFSKEFIHSRSEVHHVTEEDYINHTLKPLQPLFNREFTDIVLWFDEDMFCQINLLTVLAWLDQIDYTEAVEIYLVGDKFVPISHFVVNAKGYFAIYEQVMIHKKLPENIYPAPLKRGVELYLNYLHEDSDLIRYIEEHGDVPEEALVFQLINKFKEYGLGDTQYLEIIKHQRQNQQLIKKRDDS
ncbi:AraC family transcriptional regulator [Bacillus sp. USDA818B3_A]|uniref:AraC family transcriptional regulator n=1 Tax=Bacillus sp. USDA818B3_A TaxID=2698834 RepID=UPI00136D86C2|nr:AraC family transcriptional regulator [Bacillus sp. USDA818B3_A]